MPDGDILTEPAASSPRPGLKSAILPIGFVAVMILLIVLGRGSIELDREGIAAILGGVKESPLALPAVVAMYCALALVGFPQALLFAGTVAVFGGLLGSAYGWIATMASAAMTFGFGKFFGAGWVRRISAEKARMLISVMQKRGLLASMIVRWTPSAPFIVVNAACGASGMAYWKFAAGTGLGIMPKLALVAFFTEQLDDLVRFFTSGDPSALLTIGGLAAAWIAFIVFCRWLYRALKGSALAGLAPESAVTMEFSSEDAESAERLNDKSSAS